MNRAARRAGQRDGTVCEHGHVKKTDGNAMPLCPHGCGFTPEDREHARARQARLFGRASRHRGPLTIHDGPRPGDPTGPPHAPPVA